MNSVGSLIRKILFSALIGMLLIAMAMWGVTDAFTPNTRDAAMMVGKNKVKLRDFNRQFQRELNDRNREASERLTTKEAFNRGLHRDIASRNVIAEIIKIDADRLGLDVNRKDARKYAEDLDLFNNEITGKFDMQVLVSRLMQNRSVGGQKDFERDVYNTLRHEQVVGALLSGIEAPSIFGEQLYKFNAEQRRMNVMTVTKDAVAEPADPGDEALKTYITDNPRGFTAPEYRQFTLLRLEIADILPDAEVTEDDIKTEFDRQIETGEIGSVETRSLVQLVSKTKDAADLATAALNAGRSIDDVASEFGLPAPEIYSDIIASATADSVVGEEGFKIANGKAATVAGTFGTFYSVLVTKVTPAVVPDLGAVRADIIAALKQNIAESKIYDLQSKIQNSIAEGTALEQVGAEYGVSVASYDFVSRLGEDESGTALDGNENWPGIVGADTVLTEIFTTDQEGYAGDVFTTAAKGFAAVRVDKIKPSQERPFDEIRAQALAAWRLGEIDTALGALIREKTAEAKDGKTLAAIAEEIGAGASMTSVTMLRSSPPRDFSPQLLVRMFGAAPGETVQGKAVNNLDRVIANIEEIIPNEDLLAGAVAGAIKGEVANRLNADISEAYHRAMTTRFKPQTFEDNIAKDLGITN